ncbi:eukaryotic translation initiation factor 5B [Citrus sinensis]|nr:eukaryotic translation initiation factor 5B [Citrus sinensis]
MGQKKRTFFEEEDDIDKILAEFSKMEVSATPPLEEKVEVRPQPRPKEESARTNRNRKRKEKQKEKKAAAAAEKQEMETEAEEPQKIKAPNKRLEFIRAEIDRRNHAIQKRLREKGEQKRQEELDRQAEEAKLRKKEKEKEKKQKAKQREQQRQLESRRNQLQANAVKQYAEVEESEIGPEEEEEDTNEEWDAKTMDDFTFTFNDTFDDEEVDSVQVKKKIKSSVLSPNDAGPAVANPKFAIKKAIPLQPENSQDTETKNSQPEVADKTRKKDATAKNKTPSADATFKQAEENLRSPICCILGHVDAGKTRLLDCIRGTNVQEGEAGGITQQIGATYFPVENIQKRTEKLNADAKLKVPGLLVVDTPGHESFTNLRSWGPGLCDIAILVVDIMDGIKPQTIESLDLLKERSVDFIIALSKIITQFKEQGLNTELYYKNKEMGKTFSIVPTSAIRHKTMVKKLAFRNEVQCTILEVKVCEGYGTTIDVVLINGVLHEGDKIVEPIDTKIQALLTPHPMKELRVKGVYQHHKEIKAAQGIKITAQGLQDAIAGTSLYVVGPNDDLEDVKKAAMEEMKSVTEAASEGMKSVMSKVDKTCEGVCMQASTWGSLEALLAFFISSKMSIPVRDISIGPVHKKDVVTASIMLDKKKEYAAILAFDLKVTPEAQELANKLGVKIFNADTIYHLYNQFEAYIKNVMEMKKREVAADAVFPCVLKISLIFRRKDPVILGIVVLEGMVKVGTPICFTRENELIDVGRVASIKNNDKPVDVAKKGQEVSIKVRDDLTFVIEGGNSEEMQKNFFRNFGVGDELVSHISRRVNVSNIGLLTVASNFQDDMSRKDWNLVKSILLSS